MVNTPQTEYDSPWKEIIERYFPEFMAFFFPQAAAAIDWTVGYIFLDKELQQERYAAKFKLAKLLYQRGIPAAGDNRFIPVH